MPIHRTEEHQLMSHCVALHRTARRLASSRDIPS